MPRENDNKKRWLKLNDWYSFYKSDNLLNISNNSEEIKKNELILYLLKKNNSKDIIDLGCGEGVWTSTYKIKSEIIYACDISSKAIRRAMDNFPASANFFTWKNSETSFYFKSIIHIFLVLTMIHLFNYSSIFL